MQMTHVNLFMRNFLLFVKVKWPHMVALREKLLLM